MSAYRHATLQMSQMLEALLGWMDKAESLAKDRGFDLENFFDARLAIDQFSFAKQVQAACDTAKFASFRYAGLEAPKDEDSETTMAELRARVELTLERLGKIEASSFDTGGDRVLELSFLPEGKGVRAEDYLCEFSIPNFYFHLSHAYAILRHNGVPLGKRDLIRSLTLQDL